MEIGIWTSYFGDLSPEDMATEFAQHEWYHLELSHEHGVALLERGSPDDAGREFRTFAADRGVSFPQGHLWLSCDIAATNQNEVLDQLKSWLDLFVAAGVCAAVLHPGGREMRDQGYGADEILAAQVRALQDISRHIQGTSLTICLENMRAFVKSANDLRKIIEAADSSNIAICLDTGHLLLAGGNQREFILTAGPLLKALHVQDNEGQTDQHLMPYGRGKVPWDEVIAALKEVQFDGLFNFEIPGENRCPISVRRAKLDYLKRVAELMWAEEEEQ